MTLTLQEAVEAFYAAGNRMLRGDLSSFEAIWSDADDISNMGPTGAIQHGRPAVTDQFRRESAMGFEGTLESVDRHFVETAEMGYVVCQERMRDATIDGQPITVNIRSTTIFRREEGQWRAVHHHTDRIQV